MESGPSQGAATGGGWKRFAVVLAVWTGAALFVHAAMEMFLGGAVPYVVPAILACGAAYIAFIDRSPLPHGAFLKRGVALLLAAVAASLVLPDSSATAIQWQPYAPELLDAARKGNRPAMIDFRADWCAECKQMDRNVFSRGRVGRAAADFLALRADLTKPDDATKALAERLKIEALPAVVFFGGDGAERVNLRLVGYERAEDFVRRLEQAK